MMKRTMTWTLAVLAGTSVAIAQQTPGQQDPSRPSQPGQTQPGQTQPGQTQPGQTQPGQTQPGRDAGLPGQRDRQPGMQDRGQHKPISVQELEQATNGWPGEQREAIRTLMQKYGPPHEASSNHVYWYDVAQFKKIAVHKEDAQHLFPQPHQDFLEMTVSYRVPPDKIDDLAKFDGSLVVNRTRGTLSAICHKEEANILALNLAHEIITDRKTAEEAREFLARTLQAQKSGQPGENQNYLTGLQFRPDLAAADPDQPARTLATPEVPGLRKPGEDKPREDQPGRDDPNQPRRPGEIPKSNPETPRR